MAGESYPERRFTDEALFHLALCNFKMEDWNESLDTLTRLLDDYPESRRVPEALYHMGLCYEKTNEEDRARACYTTLTGRFHDTSWAREARNRIRETTRP